MAAPTALSDTTPGAVQTGVKHGFIRRIYFAADIAAAGAITVDTDVSDGITATLTSTGLYALANLPTVGAKRYLALGGCIVNNDGSPTVTDVRTVTWSDIDLAAGTANLLTTAGDDGDVADPTSGTVLTAWLDLSVGT